MSELLGERLAADETPLAHTLRADYYSPFGEHLLDVSEAEAEATREPHGRRNDLGRESIPTVAGCQVTLRSPDLRSEHYRLIVKAQSEEHGLFDALECFSRNCPDKTSKLRLWNGDQMMEIDG